jgi:hypothetical protein
MRKLLGLIFFILVLTTSSTVLAGSKVVAILPVINNSGLRGGHYAADIIEDKLLDKFSDRYVVLSGQTLLDGLRRAGIDDFQSVDNYTLTLALRDMRVDYMVKTEIQFVSTSQKMEFPSALMFVKSWVATVPLYVNIIDVNRGSTIYEATIVEQGRHQSLIGFARQNSAVSNALGKAFDRFDREAYIPE